MTIHQLFIPTSIGAWASGQPISGGPEVVDGTTFPGSAASFFTILAGSGAEGGTYSIEESSPSGVSVDPSTGAVTGTPASGAYLFRFKYTTPSGVVIATDFAEVTISGASYPAAAAIPMLLRFDSANGAQTGLINSGALGGTFSTSASSSAVTTGDFKYGSGSLRLYRQAGTTGLVHYQSAGLYVPLGTSWVGGMWVLSTLPGASSELRNYTIRLSGNDFVNSFGFFVNVWPSIYGGMQVGFGNFSPSVLVSADVPITPGVWHYVEGNVDGATNIGYVFVDGVLVASGNVGTTRPVAQGGTVHSHGSYGSSYANNATEFACVDNVWSYPGLLLHTSNFTPPGDFT